MDSPSSTGRQGARRGAGLPALATDGKRPDASPRRRMPSAMRGAGSPLAYAPHLAGATRRGGGRPCAVAAAAQRAGSAGDRRIALTRASGGSERRRPAHFPSSSPAVFGDRLPFSRYAGGAWPVGVLERACGPWHRSRQVGAPLTGVAVPKSRAEKRVWPQPSGAGNWFSLPPLLDGCAPRSSWRYLDPSVYCR